MSFGVVFCCLNLSTSQVEHFNHTFTSLNPMRELTKQYKKGTDQEPIQSNTAFCPIISNRPRRDRIIFCCKRTDNMQIRAHIAHSDQHNYYPYSE